MSFVSKGEKKMHNKAKAGKKGGERPAMRDGFGAKGEREYHNEAPGSKDKTRTPVSEDGDGDESLGYENQTPKSEYDPASGKRAKSIADLRSASKKISERSDAGAASPTGSEGGQDAKHTSSSKNETGYMKNSMGGEMDRKSKAKPRAAADQEADNAEMNDPYDDGEENNGQTEEGMTPSGKKRKKNAAIKKMRMMRQDY